MSRRYTKLEVDLAEVINNLALALDCGKPEVIQAARVTAMQLLDNNNMLSDHPDWHGRVIIDINLPAGLGGRASH